VASFTFPALVVASTFVSSPVCQSLWVVSVKQELAAAAESEKLRVVVPPSVTTTVAEVLVV
jgi:hypothetical protein